MKKHPLNGVEEITCYSCDYWIKGRPDGTCIHYIENDCRYGFCDENTQRQERSQQSERGVL